MAGKLTAVKVKALAKPGRYGDGGGLYLQVRENGKSWLFRYKLNGKARAMGLGDAEEVSLADAREAAGRCRVLVRQGVDPLDQRQEQRQKVATPRATTFADVCEMHLRAHSAAWRNAKHRQQWVNTLATYARPILGDMPVASVDTEGVMRVLEPIWAEKTETASRLRGRIESVLDYAAARGWRSGENPARWRGHLSKLLPARAKVQKVEHHAALPWREIGAFVSALRDRAEIAARALEFTIMTAGRTGEVLGARWEEIDPAKAVWTVPADRMKAGREHRVPLSAGALSALAAVRADGCGDKGWVFPGGKPGRPLSSMALVMLLRRMGRRDITAHGFRSTFRDWCAESTSYPREVAEIALAHVNKDRVEAAYQRGDMFEKRRQLMDDWSQFCERTAVPTEGAPVRPA